MREGVSSATGANTMLACQLIRSSGLHGAAGMRNPPLPPAHRPQQQVLLLCRLHCKYIAIGPPTPSLHTKPPVDLAHLLHALRRTSHPLYTQTHQRTLPICCMHCAGLLTPCTHKPTNGPCPSAACTARPISARSCALQRTPAPARHWTQPACVHRDISQR